MGYNTKPMMELHHTHRQIKSITNKLSKTWINS